MVKVTLKIIDQAVQKNDKIFDQKLTYIHICKIAVKREDKVYFNHRNIGNFFRVWELDMWSRDFTLKDSLSEVASLTKKSDPNKCSYSEYGIRSNSHSLSQFAFNLKCWFTLKCYYFWCRQ